MSAATSHRLWTRRSAVALVGLTVLGLTSRAMAEGDDRIFPLDANIAPLDRNITPLETTSTGGEQTVITLTADILFAPGESELGDTAVTRIGELVADVPDGATVSVDGHTDNVPHPDGGNEKLSKDRAQAVADAITAARPDLQPSVTGHGESEPVASNDDPDGRAQNRRVEIRYEG